MLGGSNSDGIPSLEQQAINACQEEILHALTKYNCQIIYRQEFVNGIPAGPGRFQILKNTPDEKK
jgi:hypothetical protein